MIIRNLIFFLRKDYIYDDVPYIIDSINEIFENENVKYRIINNIITDIVNEANEPDKDGFKGMLTVINLCPDEVDEVNICLPEKWNNCNEFYMLDIDAQWQRVETEEKENCVTIKQKLKYLEPMYIMMK